MTHIDSDHNEPIQLPDMSGEAILHRLRMVGKLNDLCRFLGNSDLASKARQSKSSTDRTMAKSDATPVAD